MADEKSTTTTTTLQDVLQNSDQLFDENQYQEAYDVLINYSEQKLADVKWRQCRALFKLSKEITAKDERKELILKSYGLIVEALELDDQNYAVHKWMAVLLDSKNELDGIKARVAQLPTVKMHMLKAVELNPDDPTNWHILGNYAYSIADMPWYQRKIVSTFFAEPPSDTYEEALDYFLRAEEKKANFYSMNLLFIAKCYQRLKNDEKAKEYLTRAANVNVL